jgi:hypothetical protein
MQKIPAKEVATDREVFGASDLDQSLKEIKSKKFMDFVNVKNFGAVGDGVTDDTVAIQNAIDYLKNNSTLYFPSGEYKIFNNVFFKNLDNIDIIGNSKSKIIKKGFIIENSNNIKIKNINFKGIDFGNTQIIYGLRIIDSNNIKIVDNIFDSCCFLAYKTDTNIISENLNILNNNFTGDYENAKTYSEANTIYIKGIDNVIINNNNLLVENTHRFFKLTTGYRINDELKLNKEDCINNIKIINNTIKSNSLNKQLMDLYAGVNDFLFENNYVEINNNSGLIISAKLSGAEHITENFNNININNNTFKTNCTSSVIRIVNTYGASFLNPETNERENLKENESITKITNNIFINNSGSIYSLIDIRGNYECIIENNKMKYNNTDNYSYSISICSTKNTLIQNNIFLKGSINYALERSKSNFSMTYYNSFHNLKINNNIFENSTSKGSVFIQDIPSNDGVNSNLSITNNTFDVNEIEQTIYYGALYFANLNINSLTVIGNFYKGISDYNKIFAFDCSFNNLIEDLNSWNIN